MKHQLASYLLAPLLFWQGWSTRRNALVLPEPPGKRSGVSGDGPLTRLLVLGDSAAAGVGASHLDHALLGQLVGALAKTFKVEWSLHAETGATTASTLRYLRRLEHKPYDLVITSLGVNDVTSDINCRLWINQQAELRALLRESFETRLIIISGLPPMGHFPVLPQPLRWYLGSRAKQFDRELEVSLLNEYGAVYLGADYKVDVAMMASDGFHPSSAIYAEWAKRAAAIVVQELDNTEQE